MSKVASPLQLHARGRVRGSTSFVSPVRSFADPVNVPNLAEQSVWKYAKSPLKKASVSEGGRRPDAWRRSARAHARLDTRTARFSRKVRRSYTRVGFQWTPTPISVAAVDAARVPPPPARFASSRRTLSLRVLLQADRSIGVRRRDRLRRTISHLRATGPCLTRARSKRTSLDPSAAARDERLY